MTIYALKRRFQQLLLPIVRRLASAGVTANTVTIGAGALSLAAGTALCYLPRVWFAILPVWMFARMAFNAIDGMLARDFGQKSPLGAYLNELTDVISDAVLYLPFAFVHPFDWRSVGAVIFLSALTEMTGTVSVLAGASRRYDGPMGKSDRAFVFSLLGLWVAFFNLPVWAEWLMWAIALAAAATVINRMRGGLRELRATAARNKVSPMDETIRKPHSTSSVHSH